jgi:hypothetical protein
VTWHCESFQLEQGVAAACAEAHEAAGLSAHTARALVTGWYPLQSLTRHGLLPVASLARDLWTHPDEASPVDPLHAARKEGKDRVKKYSLSPAATLFSACRREGRRAKPRRGESTRVLTKRLR